MTAADKTIFRVASRHKPYSQLGNAMIRDNRMSLEARGALAYILSHPSNWKFSFSWLCKTAEIGRDKCRRLLKEMEAQRYCKRSRIRNSDGTLGAYEYVFTDEPDAIEPETENPSLDDDTTDGKPGTGQPAPGNPTPTKECLETKNEDKPPIPPASGGRTHVQLFDEFYAAYPRQRDKTEAWKIYHLIVTGRRVASDGKVKRKATAAPRATHEQLLSAAKAYAREVAGREERHIAMPSTWLNKARWGDYAPVAKPSSPIVVVRREEHPEAFAAWLAHHVQTGNRGAATLMANHGVWQGETMFPPASQAA